jgi:16S rRNA (uracil1498-N3)-methyltransferase
MGGDYRMTRRRFFAPPSAFNFGKRTVMLASDEARHLREVLRLKVGDEAQVFDGEGKEFRAAVSQTRRESAELEIRDEIEAMRPESPLELTLAVALLKGEKFDLVVQKGTELGVNQFIPLITRYADIRLRDEADATKRVARWQRIALEAAKQSGRAVVPEVMLPVPFGSIIHDDSCLLFSERDGEPLNTDLKLQSMTAIIGSEGGWSDEELDQARAAGVRIATLGGRVLRAETAAIATAALLQHLYGDLK